MQVSTIEQERVVPVAPVSTEQIEAFDRDGFLVLPDFTTLEDVQRIRALVLPLFERFHELPAPYALDLGYDARPRGAPEIPEINYTVHLAPDLMATQAFARGRAIAQQLLGGAAMHTGYDHAILKSPHNGRATPWHQDQAYATDRGTMSTMHLWIALQPVTVEMGCMWFIPGSHRGPILAHHKNGYRRTAHALEATGVDVRDAVACPLPAGGATIHQARTLHYTGRISPIRRGSRGSSSSARRDGIGCRW